MPQRIGRHAAVDGEKEEVARPRAARYSRRVHPLLADPWIAAQIDAAVAPYVNRLPPDEVAWMREQLAETLAEDDAAAELLQRAKPVHVEQSGEVRRGALVTPISAARRSKRAG